MSQVVSKRQNKGKQKIIFNSSFGAARSSCDTGPVHNWLLPDNANVHNSSCAESFQKTSRKTKQDLSFDLNLTTPLTHLLCKLCVSLLDFRELEILVRI